ncbi:hypothetical protein NBM05_01015 [Rothia sp. AR01]|uniref:Uncharacterized protein n=1 Tax=Rothia santali TaxID=2949643 RepID=A0A9X2HFA5_9MICC|nr:hypothetical protein [Rothia santali]MCP3424651.1 hypothetical protein [Rothia santali]
MTTRPGDAPPLVLWLFELPGTRWGPGEARRARSAAPGLDVDVLTAVDEDETWIYVGGLRQGEEPGPADVPRPPTGELRLPADGPRLLAALLGVDASAFPSTGSAAWRGC